ncbi:tRNA pseudouridine(55) synthase TruB [Lachnobacterium bovis]|uniref:tRNA pseudouridine synthase B n=1 Tax=Lachnobacterium bovis TaxID=140626 RepID=A0A1H9QM19_9FIRM|nr:tRNA pseudouridine(55) synthase TruB [Lachnobacterium bovis]SER60783.1 tRNA pseudouridine55 synthase [Lachnobacterium bovis]
MINGIINVYKEKGFTSFDVVAKMRGIFHQKKIGHTGTLDPDAEGVLPVCLGKATKVCDLLTDTDKEYRAVLLLGQETDTQDVSGKIINKKTVDVDEAQVKETINSFVGEYAQIPPMYSALKVNGQKLVDLARKGIEVERKPRNVFINDIKIEKIDLPRVTMVVGCSKGTYIRTLCKDIGDKLGCFGCMESLVRTQAAGFRLEDAIKLSDVETIVSRNEIAKYIKPIDHVLCDFPKVKANEESQKYVYNGNKLSENNLQTHDFEFQDDVEYRVYDFEDNFIGIYKYINKEKFLKPVKMFFL